MRSGMRRSWYRDKMAQCGLSRRKPEEIRRAWAKYNASACQVKTDGARIEITFLGVEAGIFSGSLQYTVYRGSNLLRQG